MRKNLLLLLCLISFLGLSAQNRCNYTCGFETTANASEWKFTHTPSTHSTGPWWVIGTDNGASNSSGQSGNNGGTKGLYVSVNGSSYGYFGGTPTDPNRRCGAYLTMSVTAGTTYNITFDWKIGNQGGNDPWSGFEKGYVCITATQPTAANLDGNSSDGVSGAIYYNYWGKVASGGANVSATTHGFECPNVSGYNVWIGQPNWATTTITYTATTTRTEYLLFAYTIPYVPDAGDATMYWPMAVDNVKITCGEAPPCSDTTMPTEEHTIKKGESFYWSVNGMTYTPSSTQTYTYNETRADGCKNIHKLKLTVCTDTYMAAENVTIAPGGTYAWHGSVYTTPGTYYYYTTKPNTDDVCSYVYTLNLSYCEDAVHPTETVIMPASGSYTWHGHTYTQIGTYTYEQDKGDGCKDIYTLVLVNKYTTGWEPTDDNGEWDVASNKTNTWIIGWDSNGRRSGAQGLYITEDPDEARNYHYGPEHNNGWEASAFYRHVYLQAGVTYKYKFYAKSNGESTVDRGAFFVTKTSEATIKSSVNSGVLSSAWTGGATSLVHQYIYNKANWTLYEGSFTPTEDGRYYVMFYWLNDGDTGNEWTPCAVDEFELWGEGNTKPFDHPCDVEEEPTSTDPCRYSTVFDDAAASKWVPTHTPQSHPVGPWWIIGSDNGTGVSGQTGISTGSKGCYISVDGTSYGYFSGMNVQPNRRCGIYLPIKVQSGVTYTISFDWKINNQGGANFFSAHEKGYVCMTSTLPTADNVNNNCSGDDCIYFNYYGYVESGGVMTNGTTTAFPCPNMSDGENIWAGQPNWTRTTITYTATHTRQEYLLFSYTIPYVTNTLTNYWPMAIDNVSVIGGSGCTDLGLGGTTSGGGSGSGDCGCTDRTFNTDTTVVEGTIFVWGNQPYTAEGTYYYKQQRLDGCYDHNYVTLHFCRDVETTENKSICKGESYTWHGTAYTTAGTYTYEEQQPGKPCKNKYKLVLTVKEGLNSTETYQLCPGYTYSWHGQTISKAGTYTATGTNANGCTDHYTLTVTMYPKAEATIYKWICEGESYTLGGQTFTTAQDNKKITVKGVAAHGCDSVYTLYLTVRPHSTATITDGFCEGSSYTFKGQTFSAAGTYTVRVPGVALNMCDSIYTLTLTKWSKAKKTINATICDGETYKLGGQSFTTAQTNKQIVVAGAAAHGCDSVYTLNLTVYPKVTKTVTAQICEGETYRLGGQSFTTTQTNKKITVKGVAAHGCDSVYTLNLTVNPKATKTVNAEICEGETYRLGGKSFTTTQTGHVFTATGKTANGCDSIYTLNLTVHPKATRTVNAEICQGETYRLGGKSFTTTQTGYVFTATGKTNKGCDSVYTLNLTVHPKATKTITTSICDGETYKLGGQSFTTAQTNKQIVVTGAAAHGCDSVYTLNLTIKPKATKTVTAQICEGETYRLGGQSFTTTQTNKIITVKNAAANGCDSVYTLNLTVNPKATRTVNAEICEGETYRLGGKSFTTTQTGHVFTATGKTANGCDSVYTLNLTVHPKATRTVNAEICQGETYRLGGKSFTTTQTGYVFTATGKTNKGCDSVYTLNLTVHPKATKTITTSICDGETYKLGGQSFTTAQTNKQIVVTGAAAHGCDSVYTLNLTIKPKVTKTVTAQICEGETYRLGGQSFTTTQTNKKITVKGVAANGCDSVYTLNLTVNPKATRTVNAEICEGETYRLGGKSFTTTQTGYVFTATGKTAKGCDSIYTLNLTVHPKATRTVNAEICEGETYKLGGQSFTTTQTGYVFTATGKTNKGCDSVYTLNLTVHPKATKTVNAEICEGETYKLGGQSFTTTKTNYVFTAAGKTAHGCDSIYTLNLTVHPKGKKTITTSICEGETYRLGGQSFTETKTNYVFTATGKTNKGCDSIYTLNLTVYPKVRKTVNAEICEGETYRLGGRAFTTTQTNEEVVVANAAAHGCDSVYTLNLTVHPKATKTVNASICDGETYRLGGQEFTTAQTGYVFTAAGKTNKGCDSVYTLNLTVHPVVEHNETHTMCRGESYTWMGTTYTTGGTYTATKPNANGCDEDYTLVLTVNPREDHTETYQLCPGSTYNWHGQAITAGGSYTATETNAYGCVENYSLTVTVKDRVDHDETHTMCQGETYTWHSQTITAAGTYTDQQTNAQGCIENYTLVVTVNQPTTETINKSICEGESVTICGQTFNTTNTYTIHTTNAKGCDSTITLNLTVNPKGRETINAQICEGETYKLGGRSFTTTQTAYEFVATGKTAAGCDSIYTLNLTVHPKVRETINAEICEGETYKLGGRSFTTTQTNYEFVAAGKTAHGCDSIYTLNLTVHPKAKKTVTASICEGETYKLGGESFTTAQTDYVFVAAGKTAKGCDSVYTLNLTVYPKERKPITAQICEGETYTLGGQSFTTTQTDKEIVVSGATANGCDSVYTLNLTVHPKATRTVNAEICQGETYRLGGREFTTTQTGYVFTATGKTAKGCDSVYTLNLTVWPVEAHNEEYQLCPGSSYVWHGQTITAGGTYHATAENAHGCNENYTLTVTVKDRVDHNETLTLCEGQTDTWRGQTIDHAGTYTDQEINAQGCVENYTLVVTYLPKKYTTLTETVCAGKSYTVGTQTFSTTGTHTVTLTAENGCDSIVTLNLTVAAKQKISESATVCPGESYSFRGQDYTTPDTYIVEGTDANGCLVDYELVLSNYPKEDHSETYELCEGKTYTWYGQTINAEGEYIHKQNNASGCEETYTLTVTTLPKVRVTINKTIHEGESVTVGGEVFDSEVTGYVITLPNAAANGCDSVITLNVTFLANAQSVVNEEICEGESVTIGGKVFTTAVDGETITLTGQAANGSDSIIIATVTVKPKHYETVNEVICEGESVTIGGKTFTTTTNEVITLTGAASNGCDSIITANVTVKPKKYATITEHICDGGSVVIGGQTFNSAVTDEIITINAANGCDSIITANVIVDPRPKHPVTAEICDGETYTWRGNDYTDAGSYTVTETLAGGCREDHILTLVVHPNNTIDESAEICEGGSYTWEGTTYTTAGTYTVTKTDAHGCTETHNLVLTVKDREDHNETYEICQGETYQWHGQSLTTAGVYTDEQANAEGCIENYTLVLSVKSRQDHTETQEICQGESYTWHGQSYTTTGVYTAQETNSQGCKENYTLTLTVKPREDHNETYEICDGGVYNWHGQDYTTTGIYTTTETNADGCEENYTLALTVKPRQDHNETAEICNGETYTWHGMSLVMAGTYTAEQANAEGCMENYTLVLTVKPRADHHETHEICQGETYQWHGQDLTTSGVYTAVETNASGCVENYTLVLTVKPRANHTQIADICKGEYFNWHGQTFTKAGTYTTVEENVYGCDETYTLILTVLESENHVESAEICKGEVYEWLGQSFTTSGTYTAVATNEYGCRENYTLNLVVNNREDHYETYEICNGETYKWHNQDLIESGVYTAQEPNRYGCIENYTLTLTVKPREDHNETAEICKGEVYEWHGQTFTTSGTYTAIETNDYGCKETYTLVLTVNPREDHSETASICNGEVYTWHGQDLTVAGTYSAIETNDYGCRENYTLVLTVKPREDHNETYEICNGETYRWHNQDLTTSGVYTAVETNAHGCVENYTLTLTVKPREDHSETAEICNGETYDWHGQTYTTSGTYTAIETNDYGCKETYTLVLTVKPRQDYSETYEMCNGEVYTWHGQDLTVSGTYSAIETNDYGCQENYTLVLTVKPREDHNETYEICNGETYRWHNQDLTTSGVYTAVETNASGCVENYTLTLNVKPREDHSEEVDICKGDVYEWHGQTFTTAGTYTATETNDYGCTETYTLVLNVKDKVDHTETAEICNGETYNWHNQALIESGVYTAQETNANGCVEIYTLTLTVKPRQDHNETHEICQGETYTWHGQTYSVTGVYTAVETNAHGCVENYTLTLTVKPRVDHNETHELCEGSVYKWHGQTYTTAGTYTIEETNAYGCKENFTLNLTVHPKKYATLNETICEGESYIINNGTFDQMFNQTGTYSVLLRSDEGCDSIVTLNLTVVKKQTYTQTQEICPGGSFEWYGQSYSEPGVYTIERQNAQGCYDTYILTLTVYQEKYYTEDKTICSNETYQWNGETYSQAGTYTIRKRNSNGCEDTYVLNLTILGESNFVDDITICSSNTYTWHGKEYSTAGTYYYDELRDDGCRSYYTLNLTVLQENTFTEDRTICSSDSYTWHGQTYTAAGTYTVQEDRADGCKDTYVLNLTVLEENTFTEEYSICSSGSKEWHGATYTQPGTYTVKEPRADGCFDTYILTLTVNDENVQNIDATTCSSVPYEWFGEQYTESGTYTVYQTNSQGCTDTYILNLTVLQENTIEEEQDLCLYSTLEWHGKTLTESGTYTSIEQRADGCYDTYILKLNVKKCWFYATVPYKTGFEKIDIADNICWEYKNGATNNFIIGEDRAGVCVGDSSLYVTDDNFHYHYDVDSYSTTQAYRRFDFKAGKHIVEFDWKCEGEKLNEYDIMDYGYVYIIPESGSNQNNLVKSSSNSNIWINVLKFAVDRNEWKHHSTTVDIPMSGKYKLIFEWRCDDMEGSSRPLSVDNVSVIYGEQNVGVPIVAPFQSTFEDQAENENWIVVRDNVSNYFTIGSNGAQTGNKGLYITNDGTSLAYSNVQTNTFVYRPVALEKGKTYYLRINYKSVGSFAREPYDYGYVTLAKGYSLSPLDIDDLKKLEPLDDVKLYNQSTFTTQDYIFTAEDDDVYNIVIAWKNTCQLYNNSMPLAVDNISFEKVEFNTIYDTKFDNEPNNKKWEFIEDANSRNRFIIGNDENAVYSKGGKALYITNDGQTYAYDPSSPTKTIALYSIKMEAGSIYKIDYRYRVYGAGDKDNPIDYGRVAVYDYSNKDELVAATGGNINNILNGYKKASKKLNGAIVYYGGVLYFQPTQTRKYLIGLIWDNGTEGTPTNNFPVAYDELKVSCSDCEPCQTNYYFENAYIEWDDVYNFCGEDLNVSGVYVCEQDDEDGCPFIKTLTLDVAPEPVPDPDPDKPDPDKPDPNNPGSAVENGTVQDLVLAPNPIEMYRSSYIVRDWSEAERNGMKVIVTSSTGKIVQSFTPEFFPIEISNIGTSGVYYVIVTTGTGERYVTKLMVK